MQGLQLTWRQLLANQGTLLMKTSIALFAAAAAAVLFSNTALAQINLLPVVTSDSVSNDGYGISTCISGDFASVRSGSERPESG